ncbi:MAG: response regulator [Flavobacteriaceae bacterium]|nr:response regulator [Flavobacteriaceae bacterium]
MKAHILIVEDEALLYKRMRKVLEKENYTVDQYTPSVADAIACINTKRPDIVLLDIDLQGKQTGIDLGKKLHEIYNIPFIYVTGFDDDQTFYDGLSTHHEHFIVKTKPRLDPKEIIRIIQTVLKRNTTNDTTFAKEGIIGLVGYLDDVKNYSNNAVAKIPVKYEDIAYFTIKPFSNENDDVEKLRANYLWFLTKDNEYYFLKKSLKEVIRELPHYFVRINESYVVNVSANILQGRINGSRLSIMNQEIIIKDTYKKEFKKRFELLYQS